jgi:hypothetical protein
MFGQSAASLTLNRTADDNSNVARFVPVMPAALL